MPPDRSVIVADVKREYRFISPSTFMVAPLARVVAMGVQCLWKVQAMKTHACFRISVSEMVKDLPKYVELAQTRTFEIWDDGKVEILLVRIKAVRDWHDRLQISIPSALMTDQERALMLRQLRNSS